MLRAGLITLGLGAWFWTQSLISKRGFPAGVIGDSMHTLTAPLNQYLLYHPLVTNGLLIISSAFIDLFAIFILLRTITGPTIRPFLGLIILLGLRQILEALCALPQPENMIWHNPGVPSLLVTYGVANDFFFSGHTSVAVYGAFEVSRLGRRWLTLGAIAVVIFEMATVLTLRAHYTMDVFAGAVTALLVGMLAGKLAPPVDRALGRLTTLKVKRKSVRFLLP
jgi:membrane-associated phospholipid phosphatase